MRLGCGKKPIKMNDASVDESVECLVTTDIEGAWPSEQRAIFLGEWCRLYSRKHVWEKLNYSLLPYHWDDRKKYGEDFYYLQNLNEVLLCELVVELNRLHGIERGVRYWRLILGYWLNLYTAVVFDRWSMIKAAIEYSDDLYSKTFERSDAFLAANDTQHFLDLCHQSSAWNHCLYSEIMARYPSIRLVKLNMPIAEKSDNYLAVPKRQGLLKQLVRKSLNSINRLKRRDHIFMLSTYLPRKENWKIELGFQQIPGVWSVPTLPTISYASNARNWTLPIQQSTDEFEVLVRELVPKLLPRAFVEGFDRLSEAVRQSDVHWPLSPQVIWTSGSHFSSDTFKAWAADKCALGARLVIGEHGCFGIGAFNGSGTYQLSVADKFLSTGWQTKTATNIVPVGNFRHVNRVAPWNADGVGLLVCVTMPRYSFDMRSMAVAGQMLAYFNDQFDFVKSLPEKIQNQILVRLYRDDYGWEQAKRWQDNCPGARLDIGQVPIWDLIEKTRLFISTYNATTYIESLTMNIPTIIYWNTDHWEINEEAVAFFEELENIGVFHRSPQSAARFVAKIWDDVGAWWNSSKVQSVREKFCGYYSSTPIDIMSKIERVLSDEMATSKSQAIL